MVVHSHSSSYVYVLIIKRGNWESQEPGGGYMYVQWLCDSW
jgi:hypothetical protein